MSPSTLTVPSRTPQIMRRLGPPSTCYTCAHAACEAKRRQTRIPCCICRRPIAAGEPFYVTAERNGEVIAQAHVTCSEAPR